MSTALAVCHGSFGRVAVYRLDKPMRTHAHREGHLTFQLGGPPAVVTISDVPHLVDEAAGVAINPWQPHSFSLVRRINPRLFWSPTSVIAGSTAITTAVAAFVLVPMGFESARPFARSAPVSRTPW